MAFKQVPNLCSYKLFYKDNAVTGEKEAVIGDEQLEHLRHLADIVYHTHFYINTALKEDLLQLGVLKAISTLRGGDFDPKKGNLKNYLYTGMRNVMKAYVSKYLKETAVDSDILATNEALYLNDLPPVPERLFRTVPPETIEPMIENLRQLGYEVPDIEFTGNGKLDIGGKLDRHSARVQIAQAMLLHKLHSLKVEL